MSKVSVSPYESIAAIKSRSSYPRAVTVRSSTVRVKTPNKPSDATFGAGHFNESDDDSCPDLKRPSEIVARNFRLHPQASDIATPTKASGVIMMVCGLLVLAAGIAYYVLSQPPKSTTTTDGTIMTDTMTSSTKGEEIYIATIRFRANDGQQYTFTDSDSTTQIYKVGETVKVAYNSGNPNDNPRDVSNTSWTTGVVILVTIGLLMTGAGINAVRKASEI